MPEMSAAGRFRGCQALRVLNSQLLNCHTALRRYTNSLMLLTSAKQNVGMTTWANAFSRLLAAGDWPVQHRLLFFCCAVWLFRCHNTTCRQQCSIAKGAPSTSSNFMPACRLAGCPRDSALTSCLPGAQAASLRLVRRAHLNASHRAHQQDQSDCPSCCRYSRCFTRIYSLPGIVASAPQTSLAQSTRCRS